MFSNRFFADTVLIIFKASFAEKYINILREISTRARFSTVHKYCSNFTL